MPLLWIRNRYLHFGGRRKKQTRRIKSTKTRRMKQGQPGGFLGPVAAIVLAPIATNLLNGIVGKIF